MTGRATRDFVAFNMSSKRLCFLKDYWRPVSNRIHSELDVYRRLQEHEVCHVATAIGGGDVDDGDEDNDDAYSETKSNARTSLSSGDSNFGILRQQ